MTHPYERIAEVLRARIRDGELAEGERLPSIKDLAEEYSVATGTIRNALSWLQVEGYIRTSPRGTFVADNPPGTASAYDRLTRIRRTGSILADGETQVVISAQLVVPPLYVAELFDLDPGDQVLRREIVTGKGTRRLMLAVHWYAAPLAAAVPDLLSTAPGKAHDALRLVQEQTGRQVTRGRDAMHARTADAREAGHLGLPVGAPILALVHEWSDEQGLIEYGEACLPERHTIGYEYAL